MSTDALRQRRVVQESRQEAETLPQGRSNNPSYFGVVFLVKIGLILFIIVPVFLFIVYLSVVPAKNYPVEYSLPNPPKLEINNHLASAELLYDGKLLGVESIVHKDGILYGGTADGRVIRIVHGSVETIARLGKLPCGGSDNEPTCGRPLGLKFDTAGYLLVCDAELGLHKINVTTGEVHVILSSNVKINNRKMNFLNSVEVDSAGIIYLSETSVYPWKDVFLDILDGRATGRLIRFDPVLKTSKVLLEGLSFANGIQLSKDEDFILVAEFMRARIIKYNLKGPNAGRSEVFAENLPCFPDNIRPSSSGGFWTVSAISRYEGNIFNGIDFLGPRPWLRKILTWLPYERILTLTPTGPILVELNVRGEIVRLLMDRNEVKVRMSSHVEDVDGILYIGSVTEPYIARIDARQL